MISKYIYDFVEYRANECKRSKCSAGEIIPVETVIRKDQLEERLKNIYILQQPPFKKRPVLSLHKYKTDQQTKERLDYLFNKPASDSQPVYSLSVLHSKAATKCIKNPNNDSKGLKSKHVKGEEMKCISATQSQHNHLNTVNKTTKSIGRLSLKKRKLDGTLISQTKSCKINYKQEVEKIPINISTEKAHLVEKDASYEVGQLLYESVNKAFLPLPSECAKTRNSNSEGCTIPNLIELKPHQFNDPTFHCTGLSVLPSSAKDNIHDLNLMTPILNPVLASDSWIENCTIHEEERAIKNNALNSSSVSHSEGLNALDCAPLCSNNPVSSQLKNDQMKDNFKAHEREMDTHIVSVSNTSLDSLQNVLKKSDFDLECIKLSDNLQLKNIPLKENNTMKEDEQVPYSTSDSEQAVSGFFQGKNVNTSSSSTLVGKVVSTVLKSHQLEENILIQESAQFLPVHVKAVSFITTENLKTSDLKPLIGNPKSLGLGNCQNEDNWNLPKNVVNLQNSFEMSSVIFPFTDLRKLEFNPFDSKLPEGFQFENQCMKGNCSASKQVPSVHNSPVKDTSFVFQENILKISSLEAVNTLQLDNRHSKDISTIHEDLQMQCVSPMKDASFIFPANNLKTSFFDTVVGEIPRSFNENRLNEMEHAPHHSSMGSSFASVMNRKKSHFHPLADQVDFELKNENLKKACTIHETGQFMHNSPVKDGRFILPTKCLKMSVFDPVCNISYCFRLENYSSAESFINPETNLAQHHTIVNEHSNDKSRTPNCSPSEKLQKKMKVYATKNKRSCKEPNANLCQNQTEGTPQHNFFASSSPMKSLLELFQSSEANSDFLGFTSCPVRDCSNFANSLEEQSCSTSIESLLDLFHTSKDHSDFEVLTSSVNGMNGSASEYGEETSSGALTGLLELFQTSTTHSDFMGFTSCTNDLEEQSRTPIKKLLEMFKTSEAQSDFQGFTSYTEKDDRCFSNDCQEQSFSTSHEGLLKLLQTSETRSDFEGFTSCCGIKDPSSAKNCMEDQQSSASIENGLELLQSNGAHLGFEGLC